MGDRTRVSPTLTKPPLSLPTLILPSSRVRTLLDRALTRRVLISGRPQPSDSRPPPAGLLQQTLPILDLVDLASVLVAPALVDLESAPPSIQARLLLTRARRQVAPTLTQAPAAVPAPPPATYRTWWLSSSTS